MHEISLNLITMSPCRELRPKSNRAERRKQLPEWEKTE